MGKNLEQGPRGQGTPQASADHRRETSPESFTLQGLLADIVASSNDAIFTRELDGTITSWNTGAELIFGYAAGEIVGQSSKLLLPVDRADETLTILSEIERGVRVEHFETFRLKKDGTVLTVSLTVSPLRNRSGRIVGAATIARDITAQRRLEKDLVAVGEEERNRVGRDLHDGLGQQLAGMELLCRTLAQGLARQALPEAQTARLLVEQIQVATRQTRALARGLSPVLDSPDGLMVALEELAVTTQTLFGVRCRFQCEEPVIIANHRAAVHLFRIAQEASANAVRHSGTQRMEINLVLRGDRLTLEIRDHGGGLSRGIEQARGMGFRTMGYRTAALGGSLTFIAAKPTGLLVRCVVSLATIQSLPL